MIDNEMRLQQELTAAHQEIKELRTELKKCAEALKDTIVCDCQFCKSAQIVLNRPLIQTLLKGDK